MSKILLNLFLKLQIDPLKINIYSLLIIIKTINKKKFLMQFTKESEMKIRKKIFKNLKSYKLIFVCYHPKFLMSKKQKKPKKRREKKENKLKSKIIQIYLIFRFSFTWHTKEGLPAHISTLRTEFNLNN